MATTATVFECPHCGRMTSAAGAVIECPHCGRLTSADPELSPLLRQALDLAVEDAWERMDPADAAFFQQLEAEQETN